MREITPSLAFLRALVATNLKASFALRGAFWAALGFMALNNVMMFSFWWLFFDAFGEVRGWRLPDMAALFGIVGSSFGLAVIFAGGVRDLARTIHDGNLDPLLTQPKHVLVHAVGSRSWAAGWGDLLSSLAMVAASGLVGPGDVWKAALAIAIGSVMFVATGVLLQASAFWLGRIDTLARQCWEFLILFSMYPSSIFSGGLKLILFTLVPAGFIGHLPVAIVRDFQPEGLALAVGGAALYTAAALALFRAGLRRYESGNRFGVLG